MVHKQQASFGLPSTIYDKLTAHQKKMSFTIASLTSTLNTRQLMYLNMSIRKRINHEYPDWDKLHLTP